MMREIANDNLCPVCWGEGWVCENHRDEPWNEYGCDCGAGAPCPKCNPSGGIACDHAIEVVE